MKFKLRFNCVFPAAFALALTAIAGPTYAVQKFDAKISGAMTKAGIEKLGDGTYKLMRLPEKVEVVKILVRFNDKRALDGIRRAGGTVNSVLGNIASVAIPASSLGQLVSMNEIQYIESEKIIPRILSGQRQLFFHEHRIYSQKPDSNRPMISRTRHFEGRHPTHLPGRKVATALARARVS